MKITGFVGLVILVLLVGVFFYSCRSGNEPAELEETQEVEAVLVVPTETASRA